LEELVENGFLSASDIVDDNGDPLPFSPDEILPGKVITKSYGKCGVTVSPN